MNREQMIAEFSANLTKHGINNRVHVSVIKTETKTYSLWGVANGSTRLINALREHGIEI